MADFDWRAFLERWSREWLEDAAYRAELPAEAREAGWLGFAGASEAQLAELEAHLGVTLPPSYRAFLRVSNGWRATSPFITQLWSTDEVEWLSVRNQDLIDVWTLEVPSDGWETRELPTTLEISDWGDSALYLLNPRVTRPDGEWEAAFFANWSPGATVYGSFQELMQAEYASFRRLRGL